MYEEALYKEHNRCINCMYAEDMYVATGEIFSSQSDIDNNVSKGNIIMTKVYRDKSYVRAERLCNIKMCNCSKAPLFKGLVYNTTEACSLYELNYNISSGDINNFNTNRGNNKKLSLTNHRLKLDMIPNTAKKHKVKNLVSESNWEVIRNYVEANNKGKCFCCNCELSNGFEAHEVWDYNNNKSLITLVDIVPLCVECHHAIHWEYADNFKHLTSRLERLKDINGWSYKALGNSLEKAYKRFNERGNIPNWNLRLKYLHNMELAINGGLDVYVCKRCGEILRYKGKLHRMGLSGVHTYECPECGLEEPLICQEHGEALELKTSAYGHLFYGCPVWRNKVTRCEYTVNYPKYNEPYKVLRQLRDELLFNLELHKPYVTPELIEKVIYVLNHKMVRDKNWEALRK